MKKHIFKFRQEKDGYFLELNEGTGSIAVDPETGDISMDEGQGEGFFNGATISARAFEDFEVEPEGDGTDQVCLVLRFGGGNRHILGMGPASTVTAWKAATEPVIRRAQEALREKVRQKLEEQMGERPAAPAPPAAATPATAAEQAAIMDAPGRAPRPEKKGMVLVVDDEELVRRIAAAAIEAAGYKTVQSAGGKEAIEIFKKGAAEFSAVLLDIVMPVMDGIDIMNHMRKTRADIPVVLMSSVLNEEREAEVAAHCTDSDLTVYLQKPFSYMTLLEKVETILGKRQS